jgi:ABC-type sugar transport system substrate-binding protein
MIRRGTPMQAALTPPPDRLGAAPTVAFVPCLPPGLHHGMDAVAHGLRQRLWEHGLRMRIHPADLRHACIARQQDRAVREAVAFGAAAVVLFVLDMREPHAAVRDALVAGVPVVAIHRPAYPVSAAVVVPNFHQGVYLAQAIAQRVSPGASLVVLGGPDILDDMELVYGVVEGARACGLRLRNDPFNPRHRNLADVVGEGRAAAERLLTDHRYFDAMIVFNDETMRDMIDLLRERRMLGRFPLVCRNGSPAMVEAVRRGEITGTFDYGLPEIGLAAGDLVMRCLSVAGGNDASEVATVGRLFTRENAHEYVPWDRRVRHGNLQEVTA